MATLTFGLIDVCAGGDHATVSVSVNGGAAQNFTIDLDGFRNSSWSPDERQAFVENTLRLATQGLTRVQARNKINAGFTVTF